MGIDNYTTLLYVLTGDSRLILSWLLLSLPFGHL